MRFYPSTYAACRLRGRALPGLRHRPASQHGRSKVTTKRNRKFKHHIAGAFTAPQAECNPNRNQDLDPSDSMSVVQSRRTMPRPLSPARRFRRHSPNGRA